MKPLFDAERMAFLVMDPEVEAELGELDTNDLLQTVRDGEELPHGILILPARYEVCGRCDGKGTHWHESLDNGITEEERERDWDDEGWEWLMRGGMDVECRECKGQRVVPVPLDTVNSVEAQRALKAYTAWWDDERDYRAMCEMERRMGC